MFSEDFITGNIKQNNGILTDTTFTSTGRCLIHILKNKKFKMFEKQETYMPPFPYGILKIDR